MSTKMKVVRLSFTVDNANWLEVQVLKFVEAAQLGRLSIETLPAQYPVTALDRPKIDDVVVGCDPAAVAAPCSFGFLAVGPEARFHVITSPKTDHSKLSRSPRKYTRKTNCSASFRFSGVSG